MSKKLITTGAVVASLASVGIGVAVTQLTSQSVETVVSNNHVNWKGKFSSIRKQLVDEGIENVAEWNEEIWNKWLSRFNSYVPEKFKRSIANEIWVPVVNEMLVHGNGSVFLNDVFMKTMSGEIAIGGDEYQDLVKKIKEDSSSPAHMLDGFEEVGRVLSEEDKERILNNIDKSYEINKSKFLKVRGRLEEQGKDTPEWSDEVWNKTVAYFYIRVPNVGLVDQVWEDAVYGMLVKEKDDAEIAEFIDLMKKESVEIKESSEVQS